MKIPVKLNIDRLPSDFFLRDVLVVAPELIGKRLVRRWPDGTSNSYIISETEAYRGGEDKACHASKGKTPRTEVMFRKGGILYMYLIYGMYWMLNVVTEQRDVPQAVLIRGLKELSGPGEECDPGEAGGRGGVCEAGNLNGPGKLTRELQLDRSFNGEDLKTSNRIWIVENPEPVSYTTHPRIGIDYAGEYWKNVPWRFLLH